MRHTLRLLIFTWSVLLALFALAGGCGSAKLSTIALTAEAASIAPGETLQLKATGTYADDTTKDISSEVKWSSSDAKVATVDTKGLVKAIAVGTAEIGASLVEDDATIKGKFVLTVALGGQPVSIAVTPANPTIAKGTAQQLVATGTYEDNSTKDITASVKWTSSDAKVVTFDATKGMEGLARGLDVGTADLTATLGAIRGITKATVTTATLEAIEVTSPHPYVAKGLTEQFTATGIFSDDTKQNLTKQVTWASSGGAVTINEVGLATAVSEGVVTISATMMGISGSHWFGVTKATLSSIAVTPFEPKIAKGTQLPLAASGVLTDHTVVDLTGFVTWSSAKPAVATISSELLTKGVVTAVSVGTSVITATYGDKSGTTTVTVTPATLSKLSLVPLNQTIPKGTSLAFTAIGTFGDGTSQDVSAQANWGSSDIKVATVSNGSWSHGVAIALAQGHTTITATYAGKSDSTTLTVSPAVLTSIAVTPADASIAKGTSLELKATGTYSDKTVYDLTKAAVWASSSPIVTLSVDATVVANGVGVGKATITASLQGVTGSTSLTVTAATLSSIGVTPTNPSIAKGTTIPLLATGTFSDKSTMDLTRWVSWNSSDASVHVSNAPETHGLVTGQVVGQATVTATFLGGVSGSTTVTVTSATLVSLAVTPHNPTIAKGTSIALTLTGTYTDNSTQDLTYLASWDSSDPSVGISGGWYRAMATGQAQGSSTITGTFGGKSASTIVTVTAATLDSLSLAPLHPSIAKGTALWFIATGHYSDGTTQDLSFLCAWSSSDPAVALISNVAGARGLATGVNAGSVTITAYFGDKSATAQLTVTAATLASIAILPASPSVSTAGTRQLSATGTFTDGTTQDITTLVTWTSDKPATAIVSNATGSKGLVTGVHAGTATISALLSEKTGSTLLTVTP